MDTAPIIDLNSDMGEGYGVYQPGPDDALMPLITSANVACGAHAGDPRVMQRTVQRAAAAGVQVGAHPGYPDRVGFGRRAMDIAPADITADVLYQIGALAAFCVAAGVPLRHVKPHGALYQRAMRDAACADAIVAAVRAFDRHLLVLAQPASALARAADQAGLSVALELFADRAVYPDGSLVERERAGAVLHNPDEVAQRCVRLIVQGRVRAIDGTDIALTGHTLCLHSDTPGALALARAIRLALDEAGVRVAAPHTP